MLPHDGRRTMHEEGRTTTDNARGRTDDDGRQPTAIGHLSNSGDLKDNIVLKSEIGYSLFMMPSYHGKSPLVISWNTRLNGVKISEQDIKRHVYYFSISNLSLKRCIHGKPAKSFSLIMYYLLAYSAKNLYAITDTIWIVWHVRPHQHETVDILPTRESYTGTLWCVSNMKGHKYIEMKSI